MLGKPEPEGTALFLTLGTKPEGSASTGRMPNESNAAIFDSSGLPTSLMKYFLKFTKLKLYKNYYEGKMMYFHTVVSCTERHLENKAFTVFFL